MLRFLSFLIALLLAIPGLTATETSPAVKFAVAPVYPALVLAGRICGQVIVRVEVAASGRVSAAAVVEGHPMLRVSALFAARQWKFSPGTAPRRVARLKFAFTLLPESSPLKSETVFLPPAGFEVRARPEPFIGPEGGQPDTVPNSHGGDRNSAPVLSAGWAVAPHCSPVYRLAT